MTLQTAKNYYHNYVVRLNIKSWKTGAVFKKINKKKQLRATSDVLECVLSLGILLPMRRPAGLDAGPLPQQVVVLAQFRVALGWQAAKTTGGAVRGEQTH